MSLNLGLSGFFLMIGLRLCVWQEHHRNDVVYSTYHTYQGFTMSVGLLVSTDNNLNKLTRSLDTHAQTHMVVPINKLLQTTSNSSISSFSTMATFSEWVLGCEHPGLLPIPYWIPTSWRSMLTDRNGPLMYVYLNPKRPGLLGSCSKYSLSAHYVPWLPVPMMSQAY